MTVGASMVQLAGSTQSTLSYAGRHEHQDNNRDRTVWRGGGGGEEEVVAVVRRRKRQRRWWRGGEGQRKDGVTLGTGSTRSTAQRSGARTGASVAEPSFASSMTRNCCGMAGTRTAEASGGIGA